MFQQLYTLHRLYINHVKTVYLPARCLRRSPPRFFPPPPPFPFLAVCSIFFSVILAVYTTVYTFPFLPRNTEFFSRFIGGTHGRIRLLHLLGFACPHPPSSPPPSCFLSPETEKVIHYTVAAKIFIMNDRGCRK